MFISIKTLLDPRTNKKYRYILNEYERRYGIKKPHSSRGVVFKKGVSFSPTGSLVSFE